MARIVLFHADEDILEGLITALMRAGHEATARAITASTHAAAMAELIAEHQPDVVVFDIAPPQGASLQRLRELRSLPGVTDVPFVLTSPAELPQAADERTVIAVVGEPFRFDAVLDALEQVLRKAPQSARSTSRSCRIIR
jgi:DNA-binding NtrC family response regulator